ncbi:MAG: sulfite exporter TauE/SafE family protein [Bifidobacteriaceae bacterium]|jgi:uncharacterized membrane protein YfcA|nr:sulfite exporter TauE/SafE family protein [Bifidobacteriaceae bacterium]
MPDLGVIAWVILGFGALGVGFAKTAIGGVASVSVALFAWVLPAKASTGALLVLLLVGDVVAVAIYRHDVAWRDLARMVVPVGIGVGLGAVFLREVSDQVLKVTIGVVLLGLVVLHVANELMDRRRAARIHADDAGRRVASGPAPAGAARGRWRWQVVGYGALAGFTTMVANAGGAAMTLYLLAARFAKWRFLGTSAWFFLFVNLAKSPFSVALGLITKESLLMCAVLVPAVLVGTWVGRAVIARIDQARFNAVVLGFTALSAVILLV